MNNKEDESISNKLFINASEVAEELEISMPFAYKIVRELNEELKKEGYMTIAGKVSREFFMQKFFGFVESGVR